MNETTTGALQGYRAAIEENFPLSAHGLAVNSLEYLSEGWESVAVLVNGEFIFRFPKHAITQQYLRTEIRLLPQLAPHLPLSIPQFQYVADPPGSHAPYAFVGYPIIRGVSWEEWPEELWNADWWKPALGEFMTALHTFPVEQARQLGVLNLNQVAKLTGHSLTPAPADWRDSIYQFYQLIQQTVYPLIANEWQLELTDRFENFLANERHFQFQPTLIHADLSEDHVLLDLEARQITGIIDFGDAAIGDPALDVWPVLLPYYGGNTDETFEARHSFYRQMFDPLNMIIFGKFQGHNELLEEGIEELNQLFAPDAEVDAEQDCE